MAEGDLKITAVTYDNNHHEYEATVDDQKIVIVDSNGDGKVDTVRTHPCSIYILDPDGCHRPIACIDYMEAAQKAVDRFRAKLPEFIGKAKEEVSGADWRKREDCGFNSINQQDKQSVSVTDVNNDGKTDILQFVTSDENRNDDRIVVMIRSVTHDNPFLNCFDGVDTNRTGVEEYLKPFDS